MSAASQIWTKVRKATSPEIPGAMNATILGTGSYVPATVISNDFFVEDRVHDGRFCCVLLGVCCWRWHLVIVTGQVVRLAQLFRDLIAHLLSPLYTGTFGVCFHPSLCLWFCYVHPLLFPHPNKVVLLLCVVSCRFPHLHIIHSVFFDIRMYCLYPSWGILCVVVYSPL